MLRTKYVIYAGVVLGIAMSRCGAAQFVPLPADNAILESQALAISADGSTVVGTAVTATTTHAFFWHTGDATLSLLSADGLGDSEALAISPDATRIAGSTVGAFGLEATRWAVDGTPSGLGDLPGGFFASVAHDVSVYGSRVIGIANSATGREAFLWSPPTGMIGLGNLSKGVASEALAISAAGDIVVGVSETWDAALGEAFLWSEATGMVGLGDLPGGDNMSRATNISDDGETVVGTSSSAAGTEAFRWTSGLGMVSLGDLAGGNVSSVAHDVSANGWVVVGEAEIDDGMTSAFLWTAADGMQSVYELLVSDSNLATQLEGWDLLTAESISANGRSIVGTGINPDGQIQGWIAELDSLPVGEARMGDFNRNGALDVGDLNLLHVGIRLGAADTQLDLNGDRQIDEHDRDVWVHELLGTAYGDANFDTVFDSADLVHVFAFGQYEDRRALNSTWQTGDWNGDGEFDSADMVRAFQDGAYTSAARAPQNSVPEPQGLAAVLLGLAVLTIRVRACGCPTDWDLVPDTLSDR